MKKEIYSFLLFALLALLLHSFIACKEGDGAGRVTTANNEVIKLADGEKSTKVNKMGKFSFDAYQHYFNNIPGYQCPLNKFFQSTACRFFYGIPVNGNVPAMFSALTQSLGSKKIVFNISADSNEAKIVSRDSANFVLVEIIKTPRRNLLLGGAVSNDSSLIMGYYLSSNLKNRVLNEK